MQILRFVCVLSECLRVFRIPRGAEFQQIFTKSRSPSQLPRRPHRIPPMAEQLSAGFEQLAVDPRRKRRGHREYPGMEPLPAQAALPAQPAQPVFPGHPEQDQSAQPAQGDTLSVAFQRHRASLEFGKAPFKSFENALPPPSTAHIRCVDQGTASPHFARLTLYSVPASETLRAASKLPLGLCLRPFAPILPGEAPVPEVDVRADGPIRCRRCRAYLNPHFRFTHEQKFVCNLCGVVSTVPAEYQAPLDVSGHRVDAQQRPELHSGVVDFLVPESHWAQETKPETLRVLFLIDVSAHQDAVRATTDAIRSLLNDLEPGTAVGIIAYDQRIHFFDLTAERAQLLIVSDLEDVFVPLNEGLFVDPEQYQYAIHDALNKVDEIFADFKTAEVAYGAALNYALEALKLVGGGKVVATLSKLPTWGVGALAVNELKGLVPETYKCSNEFYQRLADAYLAANVGLDLFVTCSGSVDLINSANVVARTAGMLKLYSNFIVERDELQYTEDIRAAVLNTRGYQGQLKVRSSTGIQVSSLYGNIDTLNTELVVPVLTSNQQVSVLFSYDGKLDVHKDVHFQSAVLYTGVDGQRRVRVVNVVAAVTDDISNVFAFADQDTIVDIIVKNCLHYISKQNPIEVKNSTKDKLVQIFSQYRALAANTNLLPTQLVFPDSLNTLSAFISSFQKSRIFKTSLSNNLAVYDYFELNSLTLDKLLLKLYPRLVNLVNLAPDHATYDSEGEFVLPEDARASSQSLHYGAAYFVFNGVKLFLWLHSAVSPLLLQDLFGVDSLVNISAFLTELPQTGTHISKQAHNIVDFFSSYMNQGTLGIQLCRQGIDGNEFEFGEFLVEDRALDRTESYLEFVGDVHRLIKAKIDSDEITKETHEDSTLSQRFIHF